jgi:hypothetical protein
MTAAASQAGDEGCSRDPPLAAVPRARGRANAVCSALDRTLLSPRQLRGFAVVGVQQPSQELLALDPEPLVRDSAGRIQRRQQAPSAVWDLIGDGGSPLRRKMPARQPFERVTPSLSSSPRMRW